MKRLVCRKCGGSFFKFKKDNSSVQCYKCENVIKIDHLHKKNINNVDYISVLWKNVTN